MELDKTTILSAADLPMEEVPVPEWGGSVWIRSLDAHERDAYEASMLEERGRGKSARANLVNARAKLCVLTICNSAGQRLFGDEDAGNLGRKSASAVDRCFSVAQRLAGITRADLEELVKNSAAVPNGASPSV